MKKYLLRLIHQKFHLKTLLAQLYRDVPSSSLIFAKAESEKIGQTRESKGIFFKKLKMRRLKEVPVKIAELYQIIVFYIYNVEFIILHS